MMNAPAPAQTNTEYRVCGRRCGREASIVMVSRDRARAVIPLGQGVLRALEVSPVYFPEFEPHITREEFLLVVSQVNETLRRLGPRHHVAVMVGTAVVFVLVPVVGLLVGGISAAIAVRKGRKAKRAVTALLDQRNADTFKDRGVSFRIGMDGLEVEVPAEGVTTVIPPAPLVVAPPPPVVYQPQAQPGYPGFPYPPAQPLVQQQQQPPVQQQQQPIYFTLSPDGTTMVPVQNMNMNMNMFQQQQFVPQYSAPVPVQQNKL